MSLPKFRPRLPPIIPTTTLTIQILAFAHLFNSYVAEIRSCYGFSMLPTLSHAGDFVLVSPLPYTRLFSRTRRPERGDLVFATSPTDPKMMLCKRVIGLEGDVVEVEPRRPTSHQNTPSAGSQAKSNADSSRSGNRHGIKPWGQGMESGYGAEGSEGGGGGGDETDVIHNRDAIVRNDDHLLEPLSPPTWSRRKEGQFVKVPKGHVWLAGDNMSNSTDSRMYGPVPLALIKGKVVARIFPNPMRFGGGVRSITPPSS